MSNRKHKPTRLAIRKEDKPKLAMVKKAKGFRNLSQALHYCIEYASDDLYDERYIQ